MNKPLFPRADHNQSLGHPLSELIHVFRPDQLSSTCHPKTLSCIDSWDLLRKDLYRLGSFVPQRSLQEENRVAFQNTNLVHNPFNLQQYIRYTILLNMFRTARSSSSGGPIVSPQPLVSSPSVSSHTVRGWRADWLSQSALHPRTVRLLTEGDDTRGCGDTIGRPDDEQRAVRNMLRSIL